MTKEALDRIKEAYYSGLKVQIWFNGHWENFDARDYSMYPDPFSENRLYRIVGSAYVDIAEKQIADLKKENARLKLELEALSGHIPQNKLKDVSEVTKKLTEAKEIIENIIRVTWGEGWNYDLGWKVKAEQFLKE